MGGYYVIINFTLNSKPITLEIEPNVRLIDLLRDEFDLTGVKEGCGQGECGACTIIMDNKAINSCLVIAGQLEGADIVTIEGLGSKEQDDPIQQAFVNEGAIQCGYCTPGMIMSAKGFLSNVPKPTRDQIRKALSGNICRCTGYTKIIQAVEVAAKMQTEKGR